MPSIELTLPSIKLTVPRLSFRLPSCQGGAKAGQLEDLAEESEQYLWGGQYFLLGGVVCANRCARFAESAGSTCGEVGIDGGLINVSWCVGT